MGEEGYMELTMQKKVVLGLQHTIAMFGATVLVPLLTGLNPSVALVAAGVGTLLFHLVTKQMVPVFLGSSFAFIPPILVGVDRGYSWETIGAGIIGAAALYIAMSIIVTFVGSDVIRRIFPPIVTGPVITVIGIPLAPVAIGMAEGEWWLAIVTLLLPIGMLLTVLLAYKSWKTSWTVPLHGVAATFVLQWCVVLIAAGMLPFRLWA